MQKLTRLTGIEREQLDLQINSAWLAFEANLNALWEFADSISQHADDIDTHRVKKTARDLAEIYGDDPKEVEADLLRFTPSLADMNLYPDFREDPEVRETMQAFQSSEFKERMLCWAIESPKKANRFVQIFFDYIINPPIGGMLLRRSVLVSLASALEILMTSLLTAYYNADVKNFEPEVVEKDERHEKAYKKADIRGFQNRIESFRLTGVRLDFARVNISDQQINEMFERRNKIVHTEGRIDKKYMTNVSEEFLAPDSKIGKTLLVPDSYLKKVFRETLLFGFYLTQICWRQWQPSTTRADSVLSWFIGWFVYKKLHSIALDLTKVSLSLDLSNNVEQVSLINQAALHGYLGEENKAREILATFPHSHNEKQALFWKARLGLAILRGNIRDARFILTECAKANLVKDISPDWIVFDPIRDYPWFEQLFENRDRGHLPKKKTRL